MYLKFSLRPLFCRNNLPHCFPWCFPPFRQRIDTYNEHFRAPEGESRHKYLSLLIQTIWRKSNISTKLAALLLKLTFPILICRLFRKAHACLSLLRHRSGIFSFFCLSFCLRCPLRVCASLGFHKCGDQMEFGALEGGNWAVMTARDYYITARHEMDPLYTNTSHRKALFKMFFNHMI